MHGKEGLNFVLIGAGGHGAVVAEIIESAGDKVLHFLDMRTMTSDVCGYEVLNKEINYGMPEASFLVTIGDNLTRKKNVFEKHRTYGIALHPSASVSKRAEVGEGTVVMAGACINTRTVVGKHCIINTNATVDHDCILGDFVHVAPSAALAGDVLVGEGALIGVGAVVIPGIRIGKWSIVGAGAVVTKDVPDCTIVVGVPAKMIRSNG